MKRFKSFIDEKGRCWPGHKPVPGKTAFSLGSCRKEDHVKELEDGLQKLDSHDYNTIDNLMTKISKDHDITGKNLHDDFKEKHGKTPEVANLLLIPNRDEPSERIEAVNKYLSLKA
jgi:hypothetical protein